MGLPKASLPLRETTKTSWASQYRFFWRGSIWELFLAPSKGGFPVARIAPHSIASSESLPHTPGIYELALVKPGQSQRYKVYVGQTSNLRRRFNSDYRGVSGSHLRPFFDEALKNGCQIWRRVQTMASAAKAIAQEAKLLKLYDYAWNSRQAGCHARHVDILVQRACFKTTTRLVSCPTLPQKVMKCQAGDTIGPLRASLPTI